MCHKHYCESHKVRRKYDRLLLPLMHLFNSTDIHVQTKDVCRNLDTCFCMAIDRSVGLPNDKYRLLFCIGLGKSNQDVIL